MEQPRLSAPIVNAAVLAVDKFLTAEDRSLAMLEMCIGTNLASRDLECSFGANQVESYDPDNAFKPVVAGTGVFRLYGEQAPTTVYSSAPYEVAFAPEVFLGSRPLEDVYAFGATYALLYRNAGTPVISIEALPFRGGATNEGEPLLVARTIPADEALSLLDSQYMVPFTIDQPGGGTEVRYVELHRFLLSVKRFTPDTPGLTEIQAHFADKRATRAWGGFADEPGSVYFSPASVSHWKTQVSQASEAATALYNFVSEWVNLGVWEPDFLSYWTTYIADMPTRLKEYLLDELSIILP
ncbi:MAG: hypothetical protein JSS66_04995 [Armatimonadetes bacterium]|nr:hypothetical protein [Armatimonadota bacterium]